MFSINSVDILSLLILYPPPPPPPPPFSFSIMAYNNIIMTNLFVSSFLEIQFALGIFFLYVSYHYGCPRDDLSAKATVYLQGILNYGISFGISSSGLLILDLELMSFSSFIQRSGFSIACLIELGDVCFLPEYVCLSFPY